MNQSWNAFRTFTMTSDDVNSINNQMLSTNEDNLHYKELSPSNFREGFLKGAKFLPTFVAHLHVAAGRILQSHAYTRLPTILSRPSEKFELSWS